MRTTVVWRPPQSTVAGDCTGHTIIDFINLCGVRCQKSGGEYDQHILSHIVTFQFHWQKSSLRCSRLAQNAHNTHWKDLKGGNTTQLPHTSPTGTLHPFLPAKARTTATFVKRFCPTGCFSAMAELCAALLVFQGQYLSSVNLVKQFLLQDIAGSFHLWLKSTKLRLEIKYFKLLWSQHKPEYAFQCHSKKVTTDP